MLVGVVFVGVFSVGCVPFVGGCGDLVVVDLVQLIFFFFCCFLRQGALFYYGVCRGPELVLLLILGYYSEALYSGYWEYDWFPLLCV